MKAPEFAYERATSLAHALDVLASGEDVRILAGGQSLVPALNMRLQYPRLVLDISRLSDLSGVQLFGSTLRIGALTRHAELLTSPVVAKSCPLLAAAATHVAHPAIRNRGTLGGSLALADPAAEFPAVAVALDGTVIVTSRSGERRIAARAFFSGLYQTALEPDEILTALELPVIQAGERDAFQELARRHGDYAMVGLAARGRIETGTLRDLHLAFFAVGDRPMLADTTAALLIGTRLDDDTLKSAAQHLASELPDFSDLNCTAETRRHLAGVLLRRAVASMTAPA